MKKLHFAYLLLLLLAACGGKGKDLVRLEGEIKGLGDDTLYLYGADRLYGRMDTLPVKGGRFSARLEVDTLVAVRLLFADGTEYPLFMDKGDRLRMKGSSEDLSALEVSGNQPNEELTAFLREVRDMEEASLRELQAKADTFIDRHPSSLASVYLLEHYFVQQPQPDFGQIRRLAEHMTGELRDRPYMEELMNSLQEEEKAAVGKSLAHFSLPDAEGGKVSRSDFRDQYLLVHFWASWDPQSREANADLRELYRTLKAKAKELERENRKRRSRKEPEKKLEFAMLGVSLDVEKRAWRDAVREDTLEWAQVCDFGGWDGEAAHLFAIHSLPCNVLLTPAGRIEARGLSKEQIADKISSLH